MDSKNFIMMTVTLIIGVVLVAGVLTPVIADSIDNGTGGSSTTVVTNTGFPYCVADNNTDFTMYILARWVTTDTYLTNQWDLFSSDPRVDSSVQPYYSSDSAISENAPYSYSGTIIAFGEGFIITTACTGADEYQATDLYTEDGWAGTVGSELHFVGNSLTVTASRLGYENQEYTLSVYGYLGLNGTYVLAGPDYYEAYDEQVVGGDPIHHDAVYPPIITDSVIFTVLNPDFGGGDAIAITRGTIANQSTSYVIISNSVVVENADATYQFADEENGKRFESILVTDICEYDGEDESFSGTAGLIGDFNGSDYDVTMRAYILVPAEIGGSSGSGGSVSGTLATMLTVIPLLVIAGLIIMTVTYFRRA